MDGVDLNNDTTFDLYKATLASYEWDDKTLDYLFPQHQFLVVDQWYAKDKMQIDPGTQIKRQVIYREDGNAEFVYPGQVMTRNTSDIITELTLPFAAARVSMSVLTTEVRRNRGRAKLKNLVNGRRASVKMNMASLLDVRGFGMPDVAANKFIHGLPYWLVPITAAQAGTQNAAGAHQGVHPAGFADVGGISATTYARWRSYNAVWSNAVGDIAEEDLRRMGRMFRHLHFKAPSIVDDLKQPKWRKLRLYTCETIIDGYAAAMRRNRDDLGFDPALGYGAGLDRTTGEPIFKGLPLQWAEPLDTADATNKGTLPLYMLNHDYFYPVVEEGMYFAEDTPPRDVSQPDVITTYYDLSSNVLCTNRQLGGGLISYVAAAQ